MNKNKEQTKVVTVWVTPETENLIKEAQDPDTKEAILADYARSLKSSMQSEIEMLDEDVARYRGLMAAYKKEFREVKNEQLKQMEDLWHDFEKDLTQKKNKSKEIVNSMKPLLEELYKMEAKINNIKTYNLKTTADLLGSISSHLKNKDTRDVMKFLANNYKKDQ